jgi:branched-chain amino acid transport system substrate-binding protein
MINDERKRFNRNSKILLALIILSLPVIWFVFSRFKNVATDKTDVTQSSLVPLLDPRENKVKNDERMSLGEKILLNDQNDIQKQSAVKTFSQNNYSDAIRQFDRYLASFPNDPEALIYLNNSVASIDRNPVTIAVSVPIGGSLDVAKEILRGVAQAQNEINRNGGVRVGQKNELIQVLIANDDNEPETAEQIALKLVDTPNIVAVVGHNSSEASLAAAPIYEEGKLVMISPTSVAQELSQAGSYIFRTTPSSRILADTLADYKVKEDRRKKIAICFDSSSSASSSFKEDFVLGLFEFGEDEMVIEAECDFAGENFAADEIPSKAIASGADALLLVPSVDKINQALEVAKANENRLSLLGNHSMYSFDTLEIGGSDVNGMVLPVAWHPESEANSEFNVEAQKLWGDSGSWRTASAYDATQTILKGVSRGESATSEQLRQTISDSSFNIPGVLGKIKFETSGDRLIRATTVKIVPDKSSGTGYGFKYTGR